MATQEEILEAIANMTVLEVADLIKAMEEKFGVTAAAPVAVVAGGAGAAGAADAAEEKSEIDVNLVSFYEAKKINVIKVGREVRGLGPKKAKDLVEAGGQGGKEGVSKEDAAALKAKLEEAGAKVEVK